MALRHWTTGKDLSNTMREEAHQTVMICAERLFVLKLMKMARIVYRMETFLQRVSRKQDQRSMPWEQGTHIVYRSIQKIIMCIGEMLDRIQTKTAFKQEVLKVMMK